MQRSRAAGPLDHEGCERQKRQKSHWPGSTTACRRARRAVRSERGYAEEVALPPRLRNRRRAVAVAHAVVGKARQSEILRLRAAALGNRQQVVDL